MSAVSGFKNNFVPLNSLFLEQKSQRGWANFQSGLVGITGLLKKLCILRCIPDIYFGQQSSSKYTTCILPWKDQLWQYRQHTV